jgi:hypothetical protein
VEVSVIMTPPSRPAGTFLFMRAMIVFDADRTRDKDSP